MLDNRSIKIIETFFFGKVELTPNFIFPGVMFDPVWRNENGAMTPFPSKIKPHYDMPGAYVFFEPCNQNNKIEVMYIGRSSTLRNRINGHWGNYYKGHQKNIIKEWADYSWENDFPFCPYVAIFVSYGDLKDLEHWLMQLKPKFNTH